MGGRRPGPVLVLLLVLLTALTACGGGPQARPIPPSPSATTRTWHLAWFSDSGAWGVASDWAKRLGERHGVDVQVADYIGYGSDGSADNVLRKLSTNAAIRRQVADAEVVVVYASNYDVPLDYQRACLSLSTRRAPAPLTDAVLKPFRDKLSAIYDTVFALRAGRSTIVRALDLYAPTVAQWRAAGVFRACTAGWVAAARLQRRVAAEHGVPMASLYDAFNGPRHDRDPRARGLIASDGLHTTARGRALVLSTLEALGDAPVRR